MVLTDHEPSANPGDVPWVLLSDAELARAQSFADDDIVVWARPPYPSDDPYCLADAFHATRVSPAALAAVLAAHAQGDELPPVVLSPSRPLCPSMGEQTTVLAIHRLYALFDTASLGDTPSAIVDGGLALGLTYVDPHTGTGVTPTPLGPPAIGDGVFGGSALQWRYAQDDGELTVSLTTGPGFNFIGGDSLFVTGTMLVRDYDTPVPDYYEADATPFLTSQDAVVMADCTLEDSPIADEGPFDIDVTIGAIGVNARVMHAPVPTGPLVFLKTFFLRRFDSVTLDIGQGPFAVEPLFGVSYRPMHHNFGALLVLEPALDASLPTATLDALVDADIQQVVVEYYDPDVGIAPSELFLVGFDGVARVP
jgi:hypothetical protein